MSFKSKKLFKFQVIAGILFVVGAGLIVFSQVPGGFACFTDIFMGLGTGLISGCILLFVTGMKEKEVYEYEEKYLLSLDVEYYVGKLLAQQYEVSREWEDREKLYQERNYIIYFKIENMLRESASILSSLASDGRYNEYIENITKSDKSRWNCGSIDIRELNEEFNNKVIEINARPIVNSDKAENIYMFVHEKKEKIRDLQMLCAVEKYNLKEAIDQCKRSFI